MEMMEMMEMMEISFNHGPSRKEETKKKQMKVTNEPSVA
jgi:hypothetical protein